MVTAQFGEIDFSADTIGIEIIKSLYENGFPYLEITEDGKAEFTGLNLFWKQIPRRIHPSEKKQK